MCIRNIRARRSLRFSSRPAQRRREQAVYQQVKSEYERRFGLTLGPAFGFNDTFAMEIRGEDARRLNIKTLSQAAAFAPQWRAGFGYEFMERPDGYRGLAATYGLHFAEQPRIMDLGLLARALKDHQIDLAAGNATDGLIPALDLFVLEDDRHYFPPYEAVPVMRGADSAGASGGRPGARRIGGQDFRRRDAALELCG